MKMYRHSNALVDAEFANLYSEVHAMATKLQMALESTRHDLAHVPQAFGQLIEIHHDASPHWVTYQEAIAVPPGPAYTVIDAQLDVISYTSVSPDPWPERFKAELRTQPGTPGRFCSWGYLPTAGRQVVAGDRLTKAMDAPRGDELYLMVSMMIDEPVTWAAWVSGIYALHDRCRLAGSTT